MDEESFNQTAEGQKPLVSKSLKSVYGNGTAQLSPYRLQKHFKIRSKMTTETKLDYKTLEDAMKHSFRAPVRKLYSRGHEVHEAGSDIPIHPEGASPIVSKGHCSTQRMDVSKSLVKPLDRDHSG